MKNNLLVNEYLEYARLKDDSEFSKKKAKRDLHEFFVSQNKWIIRSLDVLFVLLFTFNIGALALTNFVMEYNNIEVIQKDDGTVLSKPVKREYQEMNPVAATVHEFQTNKEVQREFLSSVMKQMLLWVFIIAGYVWTRRSLMVDEHLTALICNVCIGLVVLGFDFFNDFGLVLGEIFKWYR